MAEEELQSDCRSGWLIVADDFSASLTGPEQLKYALQCMGRSPSDKAASRYWAQCGGSGMTYQQFCAVMRREKRTSETELMQAFRAIDTSGDGYITADELHRMLTKRGEKMSQEEVQLIIDEADRNGDGRLDYVEFSQLILSQANECVTASRERARKKEEARQSSGKIAGSVPATLPSGTSKEREAESSDAPPQPSSSPHSIQRSPSPDSIPEEVSETRSSSPSLSDVVCSEEECVRSKKNHTDRNAESNAEPNAEAIAKVNAEGVSSETKLENEQQQRGRDTPDLSTTTRTEAGETEEEMDEEDQKKKKNTSARTRGSGASTSVEASASGGTRQNLSEKEEAGMGGREEGKEGEGEGGRPANTERREQMGHLQSDRNEKEDENGPVEEASRGGREEAVDGEEKERASQQPHLSGTRPPVHPLGEARRKKGPPASAFPLAPRRPKNFQTWNSIFGKGCLYLDASDEGRGHPLIRAHHYHLTLPSPTHVWVEVGVAPPGNPATDIQVFVFQTDGDEKLTDLVTYTQHKLDQRWVCRMDLDPGCYALVPFSSGCLLKPRRDAHEGEGGSRGSGGRAADPLALVVGSGEEMKLTNEARTALQEVFERIDLDGNGAVSRSEFDFFQELSCGEMCDDDAWASIRENFAMTSEDELTLEGFMQLHVLSARDEEGGGEGELRSTLTALGYNPRLVLDEACPFELEVFTDSCEGEIEIIDILSSDPEVSAALCHVAVERGVCESVGGEVGKGGMEGGGGLLTYTYITPHLATIVVENKGDDGQSVLLDVRGSENAAINRDSLTHTLHTQPHSLVVGYHMAPVDPTIPFTVSCKTSLTTSHLPT